MIIEKMNLTNGGDEYGRLLSDPRTKFGLVSREVPIPEMAGIIPMTEVTDGPQIGDIVLARLVKVGRNRRIETRDGYTLDLFEEDYIVGAFGARYATDQFEGYVPSRPVVECDMISMGGVLGELESRHSSMPAPTRVEIIGNVVDRDGRAMNSRDYGTVANASAEPGRPEAEVILVVGSAMNSGKTTTAGTVARSLSRAGYSVAAAKVTGTASGKDARFFQASGASPVLDFVSAGYPSTYMVTESEALAIYASLVEELAASEPDYIVLEIADGIYQRETKMLLDSGEVRESVDHVFFAAGDALSVGHGAAAVKEMGLPLRATSGAVAASHLGVKESEEISGLPCLSLERILSGDLRQILEGEDVKSCILPERRDVVLSANSLRIA